MLSVRPFLLIKIKKPFKMDLLNHSIIQQVLFYVLLLFFFFHPYLLLPEKDKALMTWLKKKNTRLRDNIEENLASLLTIKFLGNLDE